MPGGCSLASDNGRATDRCSGSSPLHARFLRTRAQDLQGFTPLHPRASFFRSPSPGSRSALPGLAVAVCLLICARSNSLAAGLLPIRCCMLLAAAAPLLPLPRKMLAFSQNLSRFVQVALWKGSSEKHVLEICCCRYGYPSSKVGHFRFASPWIR